VSPDSALVIAGVTVGDAFSGTQSGGVGSDRAVDHSEQAKGEHPPLPLPAYRAPGGLRQDPGRALESPEPSENGRCDMRALVSTYGSRGDVEPMAGLAVQLRTLGAEAWVCAPPDCAELLGNFAVPLVPTGAWL
jgi:hypothetical protein